jgi:GT2 family glycosyltransferase
VIGSGVQSPPLVSVLIVTHNSGSHIGRCIESLDQTFVAHELLLLDNASTSGRQELHAYAGPRASVIYSAVNSGFAAGVNVLARRARGDYLLLLNPDCYLQTGCLENLVDVAAGRPDAAVFGAKVLRVNGRTNALPAGWAPSVRKMLVHAVGLGWLTSRVRGLYIYDRHVREEPVELDWVGGSCMLIRTAVFVAAGGFDESYFMYSEDLAFCHTVRQLGWKVLLAPRALALHEEGGSQSGTGPSELWVTNLLRFHSETCSTPASAALFRITLALSLLLRCLGCVVTGDGTRAARFWRYAIACRRAPKRAA